MKFAITRIDRTEADGTIVEIRLDDALVSAVGAVNPAALMGTLTYIFPAGISEAALTSAIRNDLSLARARANVAKRYESLVGKEFDV